MISTASDDNIDEKKEEDGDYDDNVINLFLRRLCPTLLWLFHSTE